jgi:hypothetical protein
LLEEVAVIKEAPFRVVFSEENRLAVKLSGDFLALSMEEQLKAMEAFYWQKMSETQSAFDVSKDAVKHEMTMVLAQSMLANLKRGEPVERNGQIKFNLEDLMTM